MENGKGIREILNELEGIISFRQIATKYYNRDSSWFYHKLNEDTVNGIKYEFSEAETKVLYEALQHEVSKISGVIENLKTYNLQRQRLRGFYPTSQNAFDHPLFMEWFKQIKPNQILLEPFYGNGSIPNFLKMLGIDNEWQCYDIEVPSFTGSQKVIKKNVLEKFPKGFKVCITNPPFRSKNSAKKLGLEFPNTRHKDLYMVCLETMLNHCKHVATLLPASYLTSTIHFERLYGVIILEGRLFSNTDCPVCLALFNPSKTSDFIIYQGKEYLGNYNELKNYQIAGARHQVNWIFNDPMGEVGIHCCDSQSGETIKFVLGNEIESSKITHSSRSITRIGGILPNIDLLQFTNRCNQILSDYRKNTSDIFLTSFKGLRKDGKYRRRIDFGTIRRIMNKAVDEFIE